MVSKKKFILLKNNMTKKPTQPNQVKSPKLRFPGFEGVWEEKKLGQVTSFLKGKGISKDDISENGINKCIRYGELYTDYREIIKDIKSKTNVSKNDSLESEENDVIIPSSGETSLDIATVSCVKESGVLLGGDLNVLRLNDQDGEFFAYYLSNFQNKNIARLAQGNSVVHLYASHLKDLRINLPKLPEQQKIDSFLGGVDAWIENLREQKKSLESYKKSLMQKIFSQQIRFKDEKGNDFTEWEEKRLGDCLDYEQPTPYIVESTEYSDSFKTPVLTAGKSFILGYTDETNNIYQGIPVIIFDDFTTASQFVDFPFKVKSSAMKILKAKENSNIKFIFEVMQQIKYEIGGHGRHWISKYSNIKIQIPSLPEQQKIAEFLSSVDRLLESKQQQITKAEEWKKWLMQGLFV